MTVERDVERDASGTAPRLDGPLYALWCAVCTLFVGLLFYSQLRLQIFYSSVRGDPLLFSTDWSAPLDDVFIHFDFARAIARGYPFEWSEGNGYSSGGTSLLYPFVLALGYASGFQGGRLMVFAATVALCCVFATLWLSRRLFRGLPWWSKYLLPVVYLSVGALDWSLFSGMEVAFFLLVTAVAVVAWDDFCQGEPDRLAPPRATHFQAALLGLCGVLVVATRPEGAIVVALLSMSAAVVSYRLFGLRRACVTLLVAAAPGALVVIGQAVANKMLTGDSSAAGALVKLELHHPHLSAEAVWKAWWFHVRYQVARVTSYHVGGSLWVGALLWVIAAVSLLSQRTRRYGALLWGSAVAWILVIALNGQVRWQNERYTMPAVAWLLSAAALGLGAVLTSAPVRGQRGRGIQVVTALATLSAVALLGYRMVPKVRDQVWFFGRASRNIRDQHIRVARLLKTSRPKPRRVLVGDAGAIPYESDVPALDIIGLGGYRDLPFARASRWGVASAVELIERIPPAERPDVLAIYPTWWGDFPLWFGHPVHGVSVRGNVICGGKTKMIYAADWRPLDEGTRPATVDQGAVVDAVDIADVVEERAHRYETRGAIGFVTMKLLVDPRNPQRTLWDAGRVVPARASAEFELSGFVPSRPALIVVRLAPSQGGKLVVSVGAHELSPVSYEARDGWVELSVPIPAEHVSRAARIGLRPESEDLVVYHVWGLQGP